MLNYQKVGFYHQLLSKTYRAILCLLHVSPPTLPCDPNCNFFVAQGFVGHSFADCGKMACKHVLCLCISNQYKLTKKIQTVSKIQKSCFNLFSCLLDLDGLWILFAIWEKRFFVEAFRVFSSLMFQAVLDTFEGRNFFVKHATRTRTPKMSRGNWKLKGAILDVQ